MSNIELEAKKELADFCSKHNLTESRLKVLKMVNKEYEDNSMFNIEKKFILEITDKMQITLTKYKSIHNELKIFFETDEHFNSLTSLDRKNYLLEKFGFFKSIEDEKNYFEFRLQEVCDDINMCKQKEYLLEEIVIFSNNFKNNYVNYLNLKEYLLLENIHLELIKSKEPEEFLDLYKKLAYVYIDLISELDNMLLTIEELNTNKLN